MPFFFNIVPGDIGGVAEFVGERGGWNVCDGVHADRRGRAQEVGFGWVCCGHLFLAIIHSTVVSVLLFFFVFCFLSCASTKTLASER